MTKAKEMLGFEALTPTRTFLERQISWQMTKLAFRVGCEEQISLGTDS